MGADIYLKSVYDNGRDAKEKLFEQAADKRNRLANQYGWEDGRAVEAQKEVDEAYAALYSDGYFRDSYNDTSLFWLLGLSWWELGDQLLDEEGFLPIDKARELLALLESRPVTSARMNEWEAACRKKGWTFSEDSPEDWRKHFEEKHVDICNMLRASIMSGEPLYWSI